MTQTTSQTYAYRAAGDFDSIRWNLAVWLTLNWAGLEQRKGIRVRNIVEQIWKQGGAPLGRPDFGTSVSFYGRAVGEIGLEFVEKRHVKYVLLTQENANRCAAYLASPRVTAPPEGYLA